jgi:hypothetical protein
MRACFNAYASETIRQQLAAGNTDPRVNMRLSSLKPLMPLFIRAGWERIGNGSPTELVRHAWVWAGHSFWATASTPRCSWRLSS